MAATLPEIRFAGGWDSVLAGRGAREVLETTILPHYLPAQRWFGAKARQIVDVRLTDWAPLRTGSAPAFLLITVVEFADGGSELYFLPLAVSPRGRAAEVERAMPGSLLARLSGNQGEAVLHDALADPDVCRTLLSAVAEGRRFALHTLTVRGVATRAFAELRGDPARRLDVTVGPATSSNSLVFFGDRLLLKLFRRLELGVNPDYEVGRFLTERGGFRHTPRVAGSLDCPGHDYEITLAIVQEWVPNQGDGWRHAFDALAEYYERASARGTGSRLPDPDAAAVIGPYLNTVGLLGQRTAEMHLALARGAGDPAFAPEPLTASDVGQVVREVRAEADGATATLRTNLDRLPEAVRPEARRLLEQAPAMLKRLGDPAALRPDAAKIRCHGDYHLGQVLWADGDFIILDFEGEPTRPIGERRAKQSPLRDVAGMLRSLDYAAYAALFAFTKDRPADFERLEPWAGLWQRWTSAAFLREYLATAAGAPFLPRAPEQAQALLRLFMLGKAFYELAYELNHRPDWVRIPLRGLVAQDVTATAAGKPAG
jgi:maltose alpha-D-glucosyltransferase/alpha-amylase